MNAHIQIYTDSLNEFLLTHLLWFSWCGRGGIHIFDGAVHTHMHTHTSEHTWAQRVCHELSLSHTHTQSVCACVHAYCARVCSLTHMCTHVQTSQLLESRWKSLSHTWTSHVPNIVWHPSCHTVLLGSEGGFNPLFLKKECTTSKHIRMCARQTYENTVHTRVHGKLVKALFHTHLWQTVPVTDVCVRQTYGNAFFFFVTVAVTDVCLFQSEERKGESHSLFWKTSKGLSLFCMCLSVRARASLCSRVAFPTHSRSVWDTTHSRKFSCVVHLNFRKSLTEIPRNGCGTMRAAAVTWQSPISPHGRLAELACTGSP